MKKFWVKFFWVLTSILLIVSGVICIMNPDVTIVSIAVLLGISLLVSGISDLLTYVDIHKYVKESGWILVEGIITILFGLLCLFHQVITAITIPVIFTIWILFAGVSRLVSAIDFKDYGFSHWWIVLIWGILLVLLGISSLFEPVIAAFAISVILGTILIFQGITSLMKGYFVSQIMKKFTDFLK